MKLIDRTGEKYKTNQGYEIIIIKYVTSKECYIRFNDEKKTVIKTRMGEIKEGAIKNPNHKTFLGVGYVGQGEYKAIGKAYVSWSGIMERAYNERYHKQKPTYKDVTVHPDWHNFQNFAKWFEENYIEGFHLDKDILVSGNKEYSADNCCFVPMSVNTIFAKNTTSKKGLPKGVSLIDGKYQVTLHKNGNQNYIGYYNTIEQAREVYIKAKKEYLIEVSEKWRGILSDRVCDAIKNYDLSLL